MQLIRGKSQKLDDVAELQSCTILKSHKTSGIKNRIFFLIHYLWLFQEGGKRKHNGTKPILSQKGVTTAELWTDILMKYITWIYLLYLSVCGALSNVSTTTAETLQLFLFQLLLLLFSVTFITLFKIFINPWFFPTYLSSCIQINHNIYRSFGY